MTLNVLQDSARVKPNAGLSSSSSVPKPEAPKPREQQHIPFLDGLRGLAVLWIMAFHSHGWISRNLFHCGDWASIDVFFVLSGFLITRILLNERSRTGSVNLKKFYTRRMLRLLPAFAVYLLVFSIFNPYRCSNILAAITVAFACMSDMDIAYQWGHVAGSGLDITWSLSVEEKFYAFWPLLIRQLRKFLPLVAAVTILFALFWKAIMPFQYPGLPRPCEAIDTRCDTIMLGCLAALALDNPGWSRRLSQIFSNKVAPALSLASLVIYMRMVGPPSTSLADPIKLFLHWDVRMLIFDLLVTGVIIALFLRPESIANRLMSCAFLRWSGKISYGLYLWHVLAYTLIAGKVSGFMAELAGYGLAFALAALSFYLVEQPFLAIKDKVGSVDQREAIARSNCTAV
jgi:peptidoglycan/LPS O-acetylase OafA/YrhL